MNAYLLDESWPFVAGGASALSGLDLAYEGIVTGYVSPAGDWHAAMDTVALMRGYSDMDEAHTAHANSALISQWASEHRHVADEARYVISGDGVFDVRDRRDRWVRIHVSAGDLLILPAGRWHRFMVGPSGALHAARLFVDAKGWVAELRA